MDLGFLPPRLLFFVLISAGFPCAAPWVVGGGGRRGDRGEVSSERRNQGARWPQVAPGGPRWLEACRMPLDLHGARYRAEAIQVHDSTPAVRDRETSWSQTQAPGFCSYSSEPGVGGNTERGTLNPIVSLRPSGRLFCYMLHGSQANVLYLTESPFGLIK